MAVKYPAFRKKFPLLVTGGLLALQPFASPFATAAEQFDCQASPTGGWACAPKSSNANVPSRPTHTANSVSAGTGATAAAKPDTKAAPTQVTEAGGRALASVSYTHLTLPTTPYV